MSYLSGLQQPVLAIGSLARAVPGQASSCLTAKLGATFTQWEQAITVGSLLASVLVCRFLVPVVGNPVLCHIAVYLYHCTTVLASPKPTLLLGGYRKQVVEEVMDGAWW